MDDTIGDVLWEIGDEPGYHKTVAERAAVAGSLLKIHETHILNGVDVTIVIDRLPNATRVEISWNEREKETETFYLTQETDKLKIYAQLKHTLIHSLITE
jgi:hypothetical protein